MKYSNQTDVLVDYQTMVETLWEAEQSHNFEAVISVFQGIWDDLDVDPDFSAFSPIQQAELFRLSGHFLGVYGKNRNRVNYQERAKNLLTNAIEIYGSFNNSSKVADAQNALAMCYIREGAMFEGETILEQTAADFLHDKLDLVYLQNRGNLLITKIVQKKYDEALEIVEEILVPMEFCQNKKACYVFHDKAGHIFKRTKQFSRAVSHYKRAINYAEELGNLAFLSVGKNNLGILYSVIGDFVSAHLIVDEAIQITKSDGQIGWLPHALDTKATIYFDEGNFTGALLTIDEAISIFQNGEDASGLTEAIWNKCKFLLHLNRKKEAVKLFGELAPIAAERMGEFAVDNLSEEFAEMIHVKLGGSLEEETRHFRRVEIIAAIRNAKYELKKAAESLKLTPDGFNQILDNEFPELYEEINIERFAAVKSETEIIRTTKRSITELSLGESFASLPGQVSTYYLAQEIAKDCFGLADDTVVAIEAIDTILPGEFLLIHDKLNGDYSFGKAQYDELFDLYFLLTNDEPKPFSLEEVELVGKAVGYLPFDQIDGEKLAFRPLNF